MGDSTLVVGGLPLPQALLQAIGDGRWRPPRDLETIENVFGDEPDGPQFYDLPTIVRQNQSFQRMAPAVACDDGDQGVGIDPGLAVLIGDLGADMPIALDYRLSQENPRVLYLGQSGWTEVAEDFDVLVGLLRI
jgi:hypothetical protein